MSRLFRFLFVSLVTLASTQAGAANWPGAGPVQVIILAVASAAPHMKSGALRAIATTGRNRVPKFENVQPIAETFPGFDFLGWFALVAPAGTPADVIARMNKAVDSALKDAEMVKRFADLGFFTEGGGTPESTGAFIRKQLEVWGKVVPKSASSRSNRLRQFVRSKAVEAPPPATIAS